MANYGWADLDIKIDVTDGGALTSIKTHVRALTVGKRVRLSEENTTAGSTWEAHLLTGIRKMEQCTLEGVYDDTASTGPKAIFETSTHAVTRSFQITLGSTNTIDVESWILDFEAGTPSKGKVTWKATIQPTGTVTLG